MKRTKIIIAALLALTLTACSDTSTAEVTETAAESSAPVSETAAETTTETTTAGETATTTETETVSEAETTVSDTEDEEYVEESEIKLDITDTYKLSAGEYNIDCTISTSNWYGDNFEFSNKQSSLINRFLTDCNSDELRDIISSGAESLNIGSVPNAVSASLGDFYFFDCNGDSEEEMLAVFDLYGISDGFGNIYAVYYVDDSNVKFVFSGAHMHRSVFFAAADAQPFIISAELGAMYGSDPVIEAAKAFTFSNGGFVPYKPPEGKSLCVRVGDSCNSLYLFNTDVNNNTGHYYMDEIAAGDVKQTLGWVNDDLKVIDGFEAE